LRKSWDIARCSRKKEVERGTWLDHQSPCYRTLEKRVLGGGKEGGNRRWVTKEFVCRRMQDKKRKNVLCNEAQDQP